MRVQLLFRAVNEQIVRLLPEVGLGPLIHLLCECGDVSCAERVSLARDEYDRVRAASGRFVLAPGHESAHCESATAA